MNSKPDENSRGTLTALSSANDGTIVQLWANPTTHRLLVDNANTGAVTAITVASANGFAGSATATTTPVITLSTTITGLLQGNGTAISAVTIGSGLSFAGGTLSSTATGTVTSVSVVTANGVSGSVATATTTPAITLTLGAITPTTVNGLTITTSTGTLTVNNAKTLAVSNTLTFTGTDGSSVAFGTGGTVAYTANNLSVFAATTSAQLAGVISDETGTGSLVFASKPTFVGTINTIVAVAALALDGSLGSIFTKTVASPSTFTQSNFSTGQCFLLKITGTQTITFFSGITWITSGGTQPTQGAITTYGFVCTGSNTFDGYLVGTQ